MGGRRIELGEIDSALQALPGVNGAAAAVPATATTGTKLLVGYLAVETGFDADAAQASLRADLPAALVPRLAIVPELPTRTSGKVTAMRCRGRCRRGLRRGVHPDPVGAADVAAGRVGGRAGLARPDAG